MNRLLPLIAPAVLCLSALPARAETDADAPIPVVTTILPYKEFIEAAGGERVKVSVLIPPGANPHAFELTPAALKQAATAALYVKTGSGIEFELVWAEKIIRSRKGIAVCDSSRGIALLGGDPHVWLSARNAQAIVDNIRDCLIALRPDYADEFRDNAEKFRQRLAALDAEISALFPPSGKRAFLILHPSWGYFARDYDLEQIALEDEGKEPSPRRLAELIEIARKRGLQRVFVSPQVSDRAASALAREIGGEVTIVNDLAGDYIENLRSFARSIGE